VSQLPVRPNPKVDDDDDDDDDDEDDFHMLQLNAIERGSWVVKCYDEDDTQNQVPLQFT
jgi:hypothetical protein